MSDLSVTNGKQQNTSNLSEDEYRSLCKQVRAYQLKNGKKKKAKPILKPIGDVTTNTKNIIIQKSPMDWDDIKVGMPFALDPTGTLIFTKSGKDRALCLNTMQSQSVGGASVYRVFL